MKEHGADELMRRHDKLYRAFRKAGVTPRGEGKKKVHLKWAVATLANMEASSSKTTWLPKSSGRPPDKLAHAVTFITGYTYALITRKVPAVINTTHTEKAIPTGAFHELLKSVFKILGLKRSAAYYAPEITPNLRIFLKKPAKNIRKNK